ncbi:hypothetical protein [Brevundimonas vesicularis]|uniref:hypothetical protein n=1 Tax=Brevundimonas vesicularis TaxID=41276 RepID=UPI0038D4313B
MLSVQINEDAPEDALIISEPVSIRCGARAFEYSPRDAPRLCWIRRPTGTLITLTARPPQAWGDNWHVTWQDCPQPDLRACHVPVGLEDRLIKARFHQGSPP